MSDININFDLDAPKIYVDENRFVVTMDVRHFHPNEIIVTTVDNSVIVQAKREEMDDNDKSITRQFNRRYDLPKGFNAEDIMSSVSSDGILTLEAIPIGTTIVRNKQYI